MFHGLSDQALHSDGLSGTWNWLEKDLTLVTIPGASHFVQQDAADLITSTMRWWSAARNRQPRALATEAASPEPRIIHAILAPTSGTRLGLYEILAPLGAGGMGEVYRARDPRLDRQVAIKLLPAGMMADTQARERLRREAMAVAALDPTYYFPPMLDGWIDLQEGKFSDAISALNKAKALYSPAFVTAWLAYAYAASGDRTRAMEEMNDLKKRSLRGEVVPFNLAVVYLGLGDRKLAIDCLERAHASDSQWMGWLKMDRMFDPLRSEPRFVATLRKLRLAQ